MPLRRFASCSIAVLAAIAGCSTDTPATDAGTEPPRDAFRPRRDSGPIEVTPWDGSMRPDGGPFVLDPGDCSTWSQPETGEPITGLTPGTWSFVEFPGARCMDGSTTGIGINLSPTGSNRVAIYLEGGGACFDPVTCSSVANRGGFGPERFADVTESLNLYSLFRRGDARNPITDYNFVYVPYCTGDVHAGTNPIGYDNPDDSRGPLVQVGYLNVTEYLERLVPTFPDAELVLLTGSSAGGFGTLANYDQVAQAFGCTEVVLLDDAGPVMDDAYLRPCLQARTRELWQFHVPEDCPQCTGPDGGGFVALWGYLATKYPDRRFGLTSATEDTVIRGFLSYGTSDCTRIHQYPASMYAEGMLDLRDTWLAPYPNVYTWYVTSMQHTFLGISLQRPVVDGVSPGEFLRRLLENDPMLSDVGP